MKSIQHALLFLARPAALLCPGAFGKSQSQGQAGQMSTVCRFDNGPRAGQSQDYAPRPAVPVGTPCYDTLGSTGSVVASSKSNNSSNQGSQGGGKGSGSGKNSGGNSTGQMSTICRFDNGPRAGQSQDYAPRAAVAVGTPCYDGQESTGTVVAER